VNLLLSDPAFLSVVSGVGYDPDAAAYIARVEGTSGDNQALETAVKDAINAFVVGCKADGIWSAIKASCILAGARTLNGALQPLVGTAPTNNNFVSGDYNRKNGLQGASGKYLDSNRNNNADPQDNQHLSAYVKSLSSNTQVWMGAGVTTTEPGVSHFGRSTSNFFSRCQSSAAFLRSPLSAGLAGISRSNSTNFISRMGGVNISYTTTSQTPYNGNISVFGGTGGSFTLDVGLAFYSIGESLDLALLDTRVTTLINAFSTAIP
jgi:hypothetical protein